MSLIILAFYFIVDSNLKYNNSYKQNKHKLKLDKYTYAWRINLLRIGIFVDMGEYNNGLKYQMGYYV